MSTLLAFLCAVIGFASMVAAMVAHRKFRSWSLRRVALKHGYVYRERDLDAAACVRPFVGPGELTEFLQGERAGRKFVSCLWAWRGPGITERDRRWQGGLSAVVLVELRLPVPAVAIRPFGKGLPPRWTIASTDRPPSWISTRRFQVTLPGGDGTLRELPRRLAEVMGGLKLRALETDGRSMAWIRLAAPLLASRVERLLDEAQAAADALEGEGPTAFAAEVEQASTRT